jgi:hypothetical protein
MKILLQCLLFLSCNALAFSAEILAWKTPLSLITSEGVNDSRVIRLEKPPEASPFFGAKDELWDIALVFSRSDRALSDPPEWIVWNATSGRIVTKVSWMAFLELQHKWDFNIPPVQCRVKIDVYEVAADGAPPDRSKLPKHSLSVITRSGEKTISAYSENEANISLECEACLSEDNSLVDLRTLISVSMPDGLASKFDTSVSLMTGSPLWLARAYDGKNGVDIMVTATPELVDGTPYAELVMRQEGNNIMPFPGDMRNRKSGNIEIGDNYSLIWQPIPIDRLLSYIGVAEPEQDSHTDPFGPVGANEKERNMLDKFKLKTLTAPDVIAPHIQGSVVDLGDYFKATGIHVPKGDLIGYDCKNQRVFIYSSDSGELDKFQSFFMLFEHQTPTSLVITVRDKGELRLMSRSGIKATIESTNSKSKQTRFFHVEPTLGENLTYVDARFTYQDKIGEQLINSIDSSATLEAGKPLKISEKNKVDGSKEAMEMKVEILKLQH